MYRSVFCFDDSLHLTLFCIGFQQMDIHVGCQVFPPMIQVPTWHRLYCYLYPLCFALRLKISFKLKKHFRKEGNKIVLGLPGYCQYTLTRGGGTFMPSKQCVNGMCLSCASSGTRATSWEAFTVDGSVAWGQGPRLGIRDLLTGSLPLTDSVTPNSSLPSLTILSSSETKMPPSPFRRRKDLSGRS